MQFGVCLMEKINYSRSVDKLSSEVMHVDLYPPKTCVCVRAASPSKPQWARGLTKILSMIVRSTVLSVRVILFLTGRKEETTEATSQFREAEIGHPMPLQGLSLQAHGSGYSL